MIHDYRAGVADALRRYYASPRAARDAEELEANRVREEKKARRQATGTRTEHEEQADVVRWLRAHRLVCCAVPNAGRRDPRLAAWLRAEGMAAGVPDLLIFTPPPGSGVPGTALEMKRAGGKPSDVSPKQRHWLDALEALGWHVLVGYGADNAIRQLGELGYGR